MKVLIYYLELLQDGTYRIGNSDEVSRDDATFLIKNKEAKHESAPIGIVPDFLKTVDNVEVEDVGNNL